MKIIASLWALVVAACCLSCAQRDEALRSALDENQQRLAASQELVTKLLEENERLKSPDFKREIATPQAAGTVRSSGGGLQPMDLFDLQLATDPRISPDGSTIVYVRRFADVMTDRWYGNLWQVAFDGSDHRPITSGLRNDSSPRWSNDGKRLLYISDVEGTPQIYLRWMDSGQTARLTQLQFPPSGVSWSPDDRQIAFLSFVPSAVQTLGQMPAPPKGADWAAPAMVVDSFTYRFDKRGYLKPGYLHVFVMDAAPGVPRQITSGDFHHNGGLFGRQAPVWTPDGQSLLVVANRREQAEMDPLNTEIYQFDLSGAAPIAITDRKGPDVSPAVSPDGKWIATVGFDDAVQGYQIRRLNLIERRGKKRRVVSATLDRDVRRPTWAVNSKGIYFTFDDQGNSKLGYYTLGGKLTVLADNLGGIGRAYGGAAFTVSRNGRYAFNTTTPHRLADIGVGRYGVQKQRVVTALNSPWLDQKQLGAVEEIWYGSSKDGQRIQGWIIKPPGFDPTEKYPLILEIHGGPFSNYGDRFDIEKQLMAGQGYVVLYTNPRGSTSYGERFGNLIHHAYPGDDFYDLNAGVDAMLERGYIDSDNLFVTGGSGGGVLTCWLIGRTDRFAAAASAYPVINWSSFVLTADISAFVIKYWFPGMPWDHPEHYRERSLLSVVKNVKTPTLLITGEEDYRTPISESEQYYKALKLLGIDTALVRVPDEPHGIARRPSHQIAKVTSILGWFEKYRKMEKTE